MYDNVDIFMFSFVTTLASFFNVLFPTLRVQGFIEHTIKRMNTYVTYSDNESESDSDSNSLCGEVQSSSSGSCTVAPEGSSVSGENGYSKVGCSDPDKQQPDEGEIQSEGHA